MGDDAEYEMERQAEERALKEEQGPRDIGEILSDVQMRIARCNAAKAAEKKAKRP